MVWKHDTQIVDFELIRFVKLKKLYSFGELIIQSSASHQDIIYKLDKILKRAVGRFFETKDVICEVEYLKLNAELPNQIIKSKVIKI